jgi:hypothetical protein
MFSSNEDVNCIGKTLSADTPLAVLSFKKEIDTLKHLKEVGSYIGCSGLVELTETFEVKGNNLSGLDFKDFVTGKRPFNFNSDYDSLYYSLSNPDMLPIFEIRMNKRSTEIFEFSFDFLGATFFKTIVTKVNDHRLYSLVISPYELEYIRPFTKRQYRLNLQAILTVEKYPGPIEGYSFRSDAHGAQTQVQFEKNLSETIFQVLSDVNRIVEYHLGALPPTAASSGVNTKSKKIVDELRSMRSRLNTAGPTDLIFVKNQIDLYLKLIETGVLQVEDNRPQ